MKQLPRNSILVGDVRRRLQELPEASIDCVITSPPYFQLRDYGVRGQIGLESSVDGWVDELSVAMAGLARVLKPTGSVWLNLGDSYSRQTRFGAPPKSLLLGPERIALRLIESGWIIRNKVIWSKTNTMPSSVGDRLACKWEIVYFLVRSRRYFFDLDITRQPIRSGRKAPTARSAPIPTRPPSWAGPLAGSNSGLAQMKAQGRVGHPLGKNPGDVITTAASNFRGAHFATFPPALVERPLLATCPQRVCKSCGQPWRREPFRRRGTLAVIGRLRPDCQCRSGWQPGIVLDPFIGSGTVALVAEQHQRDWLGIELNPKFAALAMERIRTARLDRDPDRERHRAA